jgi:hypothetical protein
VGLIALEEYYLDRQLAKYTTAGFAMPPALVQSWRMLVPNVSRSSTNGIDIQVLSHCPPGLQSIADDGAADAAKMLNDNLAAIVRCIRKRYGAFVCVTYSFSRGGRRRAGKLLMLLITLKVTANSPLEGRPVPATQPIQLSNRSSSEASPQTDEACSVAKT